MVAVIPERRRPLTITKAILPLAFVAVSSSCAASEPALTYASPAQGDSFHCAVELLDERGYDVYRPQPADSVFTAERREGHQLTWVTREFLTVSLVRGEGDGARLQVTAQARQYRPAVHLGPYRQNVTRAMPSEETLADARHVLTECSGAEPDLPR